MNKKITTALAVMTVILIIISFSVLKFYKSKQSHADKSTVYAAETAKVLPAVDTYRLDGQYGVIYNFYIL